MSISLTDLVPGPLEYVDDVRPEDALQLAAAAREDGFRVVWRSPHHWEKYLGDYWSSSEPNLGRCYKVAVALCAYLRHMGWSHEQCFVIISSEARNTISESLHASVLLQQGDECYLVDGTKPRADNGIWQVPVAMPKLKNMQIWFAFNDKMSFLRI